MKILLIDPPGPCRGINAGLGYLAGALDAHGVNVLVLDLTNINLDKDNYKIGGWGGENIQISFSDVETRVKDTLQTFSPELVGISVKTFTANITLEIINIIKDMCPEIPIVVGGAHITLDGIKYLKDSKADIGVVGEGEITLVEISDAIQDSRPLKEIRGIIYKEKGVVIKNPKREFTKDLDTLSFPKYDCFTSVVYNSNKIVSYPLLTSRGCPYSCTYCSVGKISGKKWRERSPENVIEELIYAKKKYKIENFIVIDDNFTFNLQRAKKICDMIISSGKELSWSCPNGIRADRLDKELLLKMKESGCKEISIGIESADEHVFKLVKKGETLEDIKRTIRAAKEVGISVSGFFIIGLPYSTLKSDLKSVKFAKEESINAFWGNLIPYPHTEVWNYVQKYGKMLKDFKESHHATNKPEPVFETMEYSEKDRIKAFYIIHSRTGNFGRLVDPNDSIIKEIFKLWKEVLKYDAPSSLKLLSFTGHYIGKGIRHPLKAIQYISR